MKKFLLLMLSLMLIFSYALVYADGIGSAISENVIRFHIIASSDSEYDQDIKLRVRDYVSENINALDPDKNFLKNIERIANSSLLTYQLLLYSSRVEEH